ncbi:hypothetical protein INT48_006333 [Thamnidium elegans]|uniref:Uncharacterized protein n=1 Tax=Thamnidium elegans TaxID=101142 RepID=A0A8H7SLP9_9FUNG|nr:hypothetical protein INT48_006333 [Thamnidium elegans]
MPIVGYSESGGEVFYTVVIKQGDQEVVEQISAKQLLGTRPTLVELYEYKNDVTIETRIERRIEKVATFPKRMQMMIIDYFEVGHIDVGMQLIENIFGLGKKPPFPLLLGLVNTILQPKSKFDRKELQRTHWLHSHAKLENDDNYSELDTHELSNYSDFWDFTNRLLNHGTKNLESKCRRLVLDFFVNILQIDLKARLDDVSSVKQSIFYKTVKLVNIKTYLKILFKKFPSRDENIFHLSGHLLNMLITLSYFEKTDIVNQVYSKFQEMNAESCQQLMQVIKYPTFLIELCDRALADTDVSLVEPQNVNFRNTPHKPLHLEKVLFYVLKTLPISKTLAGIYRHVTIVSKYCMCVFSTASISQKRESAEANSAFDQEQLLLLVTCQNQVLDDWEISLEQIMGNCSIYDLEIVEKIRWAIKLTRLTITEYL